MYVYTTYKSVVFNSIVQVVLDDISMSKKNLKSYQTS